MINPEFVLSASAIEELIAINPEVDPLVMRRAVDVFHVFRGTEPKDLNKYMELPDEVLSVALDLIMYYLELSDAGFTDDPDPLKAAKVGIAVGMAVGISWKEYIHA